MFDGALWSIYVRSEVEAHLAFGIYTAAILIGANEVRDELLFIPIWHICSQDASSISAGGNR
jgi:hypothetical protein